MGILFNIYITNKHTNAHHNLKQTTTLKKYCLWYMLVGDKW